MKTLILWSYIGTLLTVELSSATSAPPSIVPGLPGNQTLHVGDTLSLDCHLSNSVKYPFTITWLKHFRTKDKVKSVKPAIS